MSITPQCMMRNVSYILVYDYTDVFEMWWDARKHLRISYTTCTKRNSINGSSLGGGLRFRFAIFRSHKCVDLCKSIQVMRKIRSHNIYRNTNRYRRRGAARPLTIAMSTRKTQPMECELFGQLEMFTIAASTNHERTNYVHTHAITHMRVRN